MIESCISGPLAQLAEQGPFKPLVTGSSPVRLTPGVIILNTLHTMTRTPTYGYKSNPLLE